VKDYVADRVTSKNNKRRLSFLNCLNHEERGKTFLQNYTPASYSTGYKSLPQLCKPHQLSG